MRHGHHAGLAGGVGRTGQVAQVPAGERGHVDHGAVCTCTHSRENRQRAMGGAVEVDGHDLVEGVAVGVAPEALGKIDSGAVHKDVDACLGVTVGFGFAHGSAP